MSNIASVLKAEIVRLARREIRGEVAALRKASTQHRTTISALRREVAQLRKQLRSSGTARASAPESQEGEVRLRFSPAGLAAHRKKLGVSAQDYGALVGVSGQTIYHWEDSQRPRAAQLQALAGVRGIGKREAVKRLADLAQKTQKPAKPARKLARRGAK
jgi:DNA-binding transcriptional regulator YiaG